MTIVQVCVVVHVYGVRSAHCVMWMFVWCMWCWECGGRIVHVMFKSVMVMCGDACICVVLEARSVYCGCLCQRSARILDPGNSRRDSASFFLARPRDMIFWSLDLVSKHESDKMESRSRLEIWEWSYDNLDLVSPGESKKNNSQSRLERLHLLTRVKVRF